MNLLHLEDSANDVELIGALLREGFPGCRVCPVSTEEEFRAALERDGWDLVLSDYAIPGFGGMAALTLTKQLHPELPFIFVSGTIGEERAIEALQRGAADYVIKDRPGRLVPAIRQVLHQMAEAAALRRTEAALRANEERLRLVVHQARDVIFTLSPAGEFTSLNPAFGAVTGCREADWLGRAFDELVVPEDRPESVRRRRQAQAGEFVGAYELGLRPAAGGRVEVEFTITAIGRDGGIMGIGRDITERKRTQAKLQEQAEVIDKAPVAVVITDLEHRVVYCNEGAVTLYGRTQAEMLGRMADDLFPLETMKVLAAGREAALMKGSWRGEVPLPGRGGEPVLVEFYMSLIRDGAGRPRARLSIGLDVTEKRRYEAQLQRAERLDSIGMLAGGVAHDLNNALAPVLMAVELLRMRISDEADRRVLQTVYTSAQHGAALVRQLVAFARGDEGERTEIRAEHLVTDVRKLLRSTMAQSIELTTVCDPAPWPIQADAVQLKQILINLCLNARDAMPEGGRIVLRAENVFVDERRARGHPGAEPGAHLRLSVEDNGTGMPPEILTRIFDPFFTTKPRGKGTGLGLSMTRGVVKSHGGILDVESTIGRGTVFRLYLPVRYRRMTDPRLETAPRGAGESLLLIDDDAALGETCRSFLVSAGYAVEVVREVETGLDLLAAKPGGYALVIADLLMPGLGGREMVAVVRQRCPLQPVIGLCGLVDEQEKAALAALNPPVESLAKPIAAEILLTAIRRALDRSADPSR